MPEAPQDNRLENVAAAAGRSAASGAIIGLECGQGALLCVPLGMAIGIVSSALESSKLKPEATVTRATEALRRKLDAQRLHADLLESVSRHTRERAGRNLQRISAHDGVARAPDGWVVVSPAARSARASTSRGGSPVDTVLALHIVRIELIGDSNRVDPNVRLVIAIDGAIRNVADVQTIYRGAWHHTGPTRGYFAMAADDAAVLEADFAEAKEALAVRIVTDLFVD